jgi:hypothetical protein
MQTEIQLLTQWGLVVSGAIALGAYSLILMASAYFATKRVWLDVRQSFGGCS